MRHIFNILICKLKSHQWIKAGSCPFTGKDYKICSKCEKMVIDEK
jgi:hypothetical protein